MDYKITKKILLVIVALVFTTEINAKSLTSVEFNEILNRIEKNYSGFKDVKKSFSSSLIYLESAFDIYDFEIFPSKNFVTVVVKPNKTFGEGLQTEHWNAAIYSPIFRTEKIKYIHFVAKRTKKQGRWIGEFSFFTFVDKKSNYLPKSVAVNGIVLNYLDTTKLDDGTLLVAFTNPHYNEDLYFAKELIFSWGKLENKVQLASGGTFEINPKVGK